MKTVKHVSLLTNFDKERDKNTMNIDFLAIFKWISWGLISVIFYHFFLSEFIQLEVVIDNRNVFGDKSAPVSLLKGKIFEVQV